MRIIILFSLLACTKALRFVNMDYTVDLTAYDDYVQMDFQKDWVSKITAQIGIGRKITLPDNCDNQLTCRAEGEDVTLQFDSMNSGFMVTWETSNMEATLYDCIDLNASDTKWFGGAEKWEAKWPVEGVKYENRLYTTLKSDNGAVSERYWLNSKGGVVFVEDIVPLYLDQNNERNGSICFKASATGPYINREKVVLKYYIAGKNDTQEAHLHAVQAFLRKPRARPDDWVIRYPIFTTWAKYKKDINDDIVLNFAKDISNHGYKGQIEIDDYWETCYGSLTFNDNFSNITETVKAIKDLNFTVTLWTHPFVNDDCAEPTKYGKDNDLFLKSAVDGSDETSWWDGNPAHHIDFTKEAGQNWFSDRLKQLQTEHGIDAFKFDAGESDYGPQNSVLLSDPNVSPNSLTSTYVSTCAQFGGLIEVRSAWRTQQLGILVRMLDKDSRWGLDNGLHSLITTLLNFNINGYVFVLPDMIGGNGYGDPPTAELIVRWTQANTFMPSMQFSYLPWEITSDEYDAEAIVKKFVDLHEQYADKIIEAMENSIAHASPVNPPIWWVDPTNPDALKVNDEYMLSDEILVAPVITEGAKSRDVYLPTGSWEDGNNGTVYEGPQTLKDYPAPIDVLPYFIRK